MAGRQPYVACYAHGCMSSGRIAAGFWLTQGLPLLKSRLLTVATAVLVRQPPKPSCSPEAGPGYLRALPAAWFAVGPGYGWSQPPRCLLASSAGLAALGLVVVVLSNYTQRRE